MPVSVTLLFIIFILGIVASLIVYAIPMHDYGYCFLMSTVFVIILIIMFLGYKMRINNTMAQMPM